MRSSLSGSTSRRRGEAERKLTEAALLGRLDGSLEVERRLLCDDLGREERCVRLGGVARRGLRGTETAWTFVRCHTVPMGARARATVRLLWRWWNFTRWRRMTWNRWRRLNWWLGRSRRLVHVALLGFVHKRLHTGLGRVLHLLHHLFCIEGCTGSRWCGLRCHRCWWVRH